MESSIINLLSDKKNNNIGVKKIASLLKINEDEVKEILTKLGKEGIVYKTNNDKYTLVANTNMIKASVKNTRGGLIAITDTGKEYNILGNGKIRNGDTVLIKPYDDIHANMVKIIERKKYDYIGEVVKMGNTYKVVSEGRLDIILNRPYAIGTRVLINGEDNTIREIIGHKDDTSELEREILILNDFPVTFSKKYLEELNCVPFEVTEEEIKTEKQNGLLDLRNVDLVTIDGDDTKDFDDAVGYYNNTIYISIADVNKYIKEKTAMWDETLKRGTSVYPPGCVNPMIHENLSNGICSLIPGEDRYSITLILKTDNSGRVINYKISESIINNKKRMTYGEVNKYLEENIVSDGYEDYTDILDNLYNEAMKVKNKMLEEGFLEFTSDEVKFLFENSGIVAIKGRHQGKAEDLIEFLMLLHNVTMTNYFVKNNLPFISRFHGEPNDEKLEVWNELLKRRGYKVNTTKRFNQKIIREKQKTYIDSTERVVLDSMAIRSQSKAKYSAYNIGHYALALEAYSTFSSPIRRLADFINQRVYKDSIKYGIKHARDKWNEIMPYLAKIATDSEMRADRVERKIDDIRKAEYMERYIGSYYDALVADIKSSYIKVLIPDTMTYGKIYFDKKNYHLNKDGFSLRSNSGSTILVGDTLSARLIKVNKNEGELVFKNNCEEVKEQYNEEEKSKKKIKKR